MHHLRLAEPSGGDGPVIFGGRLDYHNLVINEQIPNVKTRAELDTLLSRGADIDARTDWWAGGFGLLDLAPKDVALYAIERGATVTPHAAARLDLLPTLKQLVAADPDAVRARGGDGQSPLHFAATVPIASFLLDHGADIDALDIDHESTPAQYMLDSRPDVARYLVSRGAKTDLLMAAALGDISLGEKHLSQVRLRVSDEDFPMVGGHAGGTIYQWQLGWYVGAAQVAKKFGHEAFFHWVIERSPADENLLSACWLGDAQMAAGLRGTTGFPAPSLRHVAHAARNNNLAAVELMLAAGLPAQAYTQHHGSALHWAAWHGNVRMVQLLLAKDADRQNCDNQYKGTPLDWAKHGQNNGWERATGDYPGTLAALAM